jgi:hypothetical protein
MPFGRIERRIEQSSPWIVLLTMQLSLTSFLDRGDQTKDKRRIQNKPGGNVFILGGREIRFFQLPVRGI